MIAQSNLEDRNGMINFYASRYGITDYHNYFRNSGSLIGLLSTFSATDLTFYRETLFILANGDTITNHHLANAFYLTILATTSS